MGEVIAITSRRKKVDTNSSDMLAFRAKILGMDKLELLEEMVRFQEERSMLGNLTPDMMVRGQVLFKALEDASETPELRLLTRSYRRHLEYEYKSYLNGGKG
jgi:hypothetical protein